MKSKLFLCVLLIVGGAQNLKSSDTALQTVVKLFIESCMTNNSKQLEAILAEDAVFKQTRNKVTVKHTRQEVLDFMKKDKGILQDFKPAYEIINSSGNTALVKVKFHYPQFTIENILTLEKQEKSSWKIAQVEKFYTSDVTAGIPYNGSKEDQ